MKLENSLKRLLEERRIWYKTINKIYCPCLSKDIIFNPKGFIHLCYDSNGKARLKKEQMYKLGLNAKSKIVTDIQKSDKPAELLEKTWKKLDNT